MNQSKLRDPRFQECWRKSGATKTVTSPTVSIFLSENDRRAPQMNDEDRRRCLRGLLKLRRILFTTQFNELAKLGLSHIYIWDPDDETVCAKLEFEGQGEYVFEWEDPSRFPTDRAWVRVRCDDLRALWKALNHKNGIKDLVRITGVCEMSLSYPPDVIEHGSAPGLLISNYVGPKCWPNSDFSIRPFGWVEYHG